MIVLLLYVELYQYFVGVHRCISLVPFLFSYALSLSLSHFFNQNLDQVNWNSIQNARKPKIKTMKTMQMRFERARYFFYSFYSLSLCSLFSANSPPFRLRVRVYPIPIVCEGSECSVFGLDLLCLRVRDEAFVNCV